MHIKIPCNHLDSCDQSDVESIWVALRPHKLPREITSIILGVIYHSTSNKEPENVVLRDHVQNNLNTLLCKEPNALVLLTGDFNPTSTGFKMKYITQTNNLKQLISFKTRDSAVLDWLLTNRPKMFEVSRLPKVGSSDHYTILAKPNIAIPPKQTITKITIRDMRNSAWNAFGRWITEKNWSSVLSENSSKDKFDLFMSELNRAINTYLPPKMIKKKHPTDRPWITNMIKLWISKRQSAFQQQGKNSKDFRFWRNKVQRAIQSAKSNYFHNKVADIDKVNPAKWWKEIKKLSGQNVRQEWYHQFLDNNMDIESIANKVNDFFVSLTDHFVPLSQPTPPLEILEEFLVTEREVFKALASLQTSKAIGPDNIPNRILKEFALELAPVICNIYNQSMKEANIPSPLKSSIVIPVPKISPPQTIENDLRPISLTSTMAKVMEGFTCTRLLKDLEGKIDPRQYARKGHSTTDALLYMMQTIHEALDAGEAGARIFFADFSKGFDLIDHSILIQELNKLQVHPALLAWISAFLFNRRQAVRIGNVLSQWKTLKGGIPQGTKLGVVLFMVMTNSLLTNWHLRTKFVDDTSALEIIPRNSISLLNFAVSDIHEFANEHKMKLNPKKCKEMLINFLHNPNFLLRPIQIGNNIIERVATYKSLGVILSSDLKWNSHIEYIVKKANKKLYPLRVLRRAGVDQKNLLKVYLCSVRPVLEYAVPIWQNIPDYLSNEIESVQKRALKIIFPECESYAEALNFAQLPTLTARRVRICQKYMAKMRRENHPLLPIPVVPDYDINLRQYTDRSYLFNNVTDCRTIKAQSFFTFKYF